MEPMKRTVYKYNGIEIRYTTDCSCYYCCGEVVFWDELKKDVIKSIAVDAKEAAVLMKEWVKNSPPFVMCRQY